MKPFIAREMTLKSHSRSSATSSFVIAWTGSEIGKVGYTIFRENSWNNLEGH